MGDFFRAYTVLFSEPDHGIKACLQCGCQYGLVSPTTGVAHARLSCANGVCNRFVKWLPKPRNEGKTQRTDTRGLLDKYSRGFCEMCLRAEVDLPRSQVLHAHHVIEKQSGGDESRENIWIVCTKCHKYIHHERTYLGHYSQVQREAAIDVVA